MLMAPTNARTQRPAADFYEGFVDKYKEFEADAQSSEVV